MHFNEDAKIRDCCNLVDHVVLLDKFTKTYTLKQGRSLYSDIAPDGLLFSEDFRGFLSLSMLVCNQQWTAPETCVSGSVACRRPVCLEPLRSVQEMLRAWIFVKLPFRNHVLLRVWALTLVFRT